MFSKLQPENIKTDILRDTSADGTILKWDILHFFTKSFKCLNVFFFSSVYQSQNPDRVHVFYYDVTIPLWNNICEGVRSQ
jgi:hypothetical protein